MTELLINAVADWRLIALVVLLFAVLSVWGMVLGAGEPIDTSPLTGWCPRTGDTFETYDVWDTGVEGFVYTYCPRCDEKGNVGVFRNPNKPAIHAIEKSETAHAAIVDGFEFKA